MPSVGSASRSRQSARRIREMSNVPIVFISDRRDVFSMERALHIGDDYLAPPWSWESSAAKRGRSSEVAVRHTPLTAMLPPDASSA